MTYPTGISLDGSGNLYVSDADTVRKVSASGAALTFGPSGPPQQSYLTNIGNMNLNLSSVTLQNTGIGFSDSADCVTASGTGFLPSVAVPGSYCYAQVSFTPQSAGTVTTSLTFADDALDTAGSQQTVTLNGAFQ